MTPEEARAEWVAALRSGEYNQATGQLATETGYCCLGVACEVAKMHGVIQSYDPLQGGMPGTVAAWLGFENDGSGDGLLEEPPAGSEYRSLTSLNDINKWSFDQIADVIETERFRNDATVVA